MSFYDLSSSSYETDTKYRYYDILDELGSGAFGTVYLCRVHETGEEVAIKKITPDKGDEEDYLEEFENFSQLCHPRLIQYLGYFTSGKYYNLVLEYAPHGTLEAEIECRWNNQDFWYEDDVLDLFVDMLIGVEYLHDNGFIHRDLKPDNVLFGYDGRLKLTDFGMAAVMDRAGYHYLWASKYGARCYAAPELLAHKWYNEKIDVWSLGVILHEMCALRHPFFQSYPTPNVDYLEDYSDELNDLIHMMLVRSRHERASLSEVINQDIVYYKYQNGC